jgi:pimeloyl-ACP methyl ester carboxylesterase
MWDSTLAQARSSDVTLRAPRTLLSAVRTDLDVLGPIWADEQQRWVVRQRRATFSVVDGAGHGIHRDRPEEVIAAIRRASSLSEGGRR